MNPHPNPATQPNTGEGTFRGSAKTWIGVVIAVACSVLLTLITLAPPTVPGDWARLDAAGRYMPSVINYQWPSYALQVGLWLGIVGGLWLAVYSRQSIVNSQQSNPQRWLPYTLLIIITLLGFGLRLHTLGRLPLIIDEIGFAARASDILHGQHIPIFAPGHNGNPSTYSWLLAGAMALWGQNTFAMRLLSLACGTLCIPAAYTLGRVWWGRQVGLLAASFLAVYPAHVHFSRLALYNAVDPLFALLALTALARALRWGRTSPTGPLSIAMKRGRKPGLLSIVSFGDFVVVGVLVGVAQYFYHGSRLLLVLIAVYVVLKNNTLNTKIKIFFIMFFSFTLVSLPRFAPLLAGGLPLTGNLDGVRLPSDLADNALRSLLAWVGQPDVSPFWLSRAPLLPLLALLALLAAGVGMVVCMRGWRDPRHAVLLLTIILTTVFGGVIWAAAPLYVRYMTALPAIVLLVGVGMQKLQRNGAKGQRRKGWLSALMITVVMGQSIILSLQHPAEAYSRISKGLWEEDRLAHEAAALPAGESADFAVTSAFGAVERITLADYIAAYGQRRAVSISPP